MHTAENAEIAERNNYLIRLTGLRLQRFFLCVFLSDLSALCDNLFKSFYSPLGWKECFWSFRRWQ